MPVKKRASTRSPSALFRDFSAAEQRLLRRLNTPAKVQTYLEGLRYNKELAGDTCSSPRTVLRRGSAQCMEGALFAAMCMRFHGHKALVMDLEAQHDHDHVLCVFRSKGLWGAISKSKFHSLSYRDPVFRTLRELALSYFPNYHNYRGTKTLRKYSVPLSLAQFDRIHWMSSDDDVWAIPERLCTIKHYALYPRAIIPSLRVVPLPRQYADTAYPPRGWKNKPPKRGY
jgi:hypothetical protein